MAQGGEARQIEEAAIAFDGVDEAEDRIEPRLVPRRRLPRNHLPGERIEHLPGLSREFLDQVVHAGVMDGRG